MKNLILSLSLSLLSLSVNAQLLQEEKFSLIGSYFVESIATCRYDSLPDDLLDMKYYYIDGTSISILSDTIAVKIDNRTFNYVFLLSDLNRTFIYNEKPVKIYHLVVIDESWEAPEVYYYEFSEKNRFDLLQIRYSKYPTMEGGVVVYQLKPIKVIDSVTLSE